MLTGPNSISLTISCFNGMMIFFLFVSILSTIRLLSISLLSVL